VDHSAMGLLAILILGDKCALVILVLGDGHVLIMVVNIVCRYEMDSIGFEH
jgi:hypothetical protein